MLWFFVLIRLLKFKPLKRAPVIIAALVLVFICGLRMLRLDFFDRLECFTYDLRAKAALNFSAPAATNLAFVAMDDSSIAAVKSGALGYKYGLYWPRQIYGRLVDELSAQGAQTVAFDVLFGELRDDHPSVQMADGNTMESDDFFALQMHQAGNVVLAVTPELRPPDLFATNALALGGISTDKDSDGTLRRVEAFHMYHRWHPLIESAAQKNGVNSTNIFVEKNKVVLVLDSGESKEIPLDENGELSLRSRKNPEATAKAKPFTDERIWHMGIVLAAEELKLDLKNAEIDLAHGKISLHGTNGLEHIMPVDPAGYFYIDWRLPPNDPHLLSAPIENLLLQDRQRLLGETNGLGDPFRGKLVIIGSTAQGNDLTDRGATPLENDTFLVSQYWNVANSIITNQFIRRASLPVELALIILLGAFTAFLTWQLRAFSATGGTVLLMVAYITVAFFSFVEFRWWLPIVFPVLAVSVEHIMLVTYRVVFEEDEKRRVKSVFSKIVSPDVMNELLQAKRLALGGARREVTVFFADVRGFTTFTDETQERVSEFVFSHQLDLEAAEKCFDESARETLETVNLYLSTVADAVKNHGGTVDKYIGDCVMAFWNAPVANEKHALACVRAAIEGQRAIYELNQKRLAQNASREIENSARLSAGLPPKLLLTALQLGTGINTGLVTVGLMGSETHQSNYTVFGREVNLASRLEGVSGSGRIIISETTYNHLLRHAPEIAATCKELPPEKVKGFRAAMRIFEVPWQNK